MGRTAEDGYTNDTQPYREFPPLNIELIRDPIFQGDRTLPRLKQPAYKIAGRPHSERVNKKGPVPFRTWESKTGHINMTARPRVEL